MNPRRFLYSLPLALPLLGLPLLGLSLRAGAADCDQAARLYEQALAAADPSAKARLLEASVAACPETLAYYQLGVARLALGEPQAAAEALRQARERATDDPEIQAAILGRQAQARLALGEVPEALAAADAARSLFATEGPDWFTRVRTAIDQDPGRQAMTAETIGRFFTAQRRVTLCVAGRPCAAAARPRLDLYILFDTDQDQPNAAGLKTVGELGRYLAGAGKAFDPRPSPGPGPAPGGWVVEVIGHTDKCGSDTHNQDLSERRARRVAALIERDYPDLRGRLSTAGRGEREPRYPSGDRPPDCDQPLNRRVAVVLPRS